MRPKVTKSASPVPDDNEQMECRYSLAQEPGNAEEDDEEAD